MKIYLKKFLLGQVTLIFVLACFALSPQARAVCQEGCLTNENTVLGEDALLSNTGRFSTAIGFNALQSNTTTGFWNTAIGAYALASNTIGDDSTAIGFNALQSNTTGFSNTAIGAYALWPNSTGANNTATGFRALHGNTTGANNTAIGVDALFFNTSGNNNSALGEGALDSNTTGELNTAIGFDALAFNTTGNENTATGVDALVSNTSGHDNTATGSTALAKNTTGSFNIALGANAGFNLTTGDHNIDIGAKGLAGDTETIRIGRAQRNTYIAGISGVTVAGGVGVIIDTSGHLGTVVSSERFKDQVKPMDKASEAIFSLEPVAFRYKKELDPAGIPQFGLVAEEVEKVNPDLVARDEQGKPYTVRYEAVNAMLLNEFLKEHEKVQRLEAALAAVNERLKAQDAKIDKVNAKVELTKPAPQMVVNDQ